MSGVEQDTFARENDWHLDALCSNAPELMFPETGRVDQNRAARWLCGQCIVREVCLEDALRHPQPYGIRAGLTPRELTAIRIELGMREQELRDKYDQARYLRDVEGRTLNYIADRLGYASHGGVAALIKRFEKREEGS